MSTLIGGIFKLFKKIKCNQRSKNAPFEILKSILKDIKTDKRINKLENRK